MIKWILSSLAACCVCNAQTTVIYSADFTDSSSYSSGPLNGQNNWSTDSGGGIEILSGTGAVLSGFEAAANSTSSSASTVAGGETYTSSLTFTFDDVSSGNNNAPIIGAAIYSGPEATDTMINGLLQKSQATYRFQLRSDWGSQNTNLGFTQSGTFTPEEIGITIGSDQTSDVLTLSLALTAGADAGTWNATVTLFNETTATQVFQWTPTASNLIFTDLNSTVYGGFAAAQTDSNAQVENRTVQSAEFKSSQVENRLGLMIITSAAL